MKIINFFLDSTCVNIFAKQSNFTMLLIAVFGCLNDRLSTTHYHNSEPKNNAQKMR